MHVFLLVYAKFFCLVFSKRMALYLYALMALMLPSTVLASNLEEQMGQSLQNHLLINQYYFIGIVMVVILLLLSIGFFWWRFVRFRTDSLLESKNKLQDILDALPDLLFELDEDGRYLDYHSPRTDLLVAPIDKLLGRTVNEMLPPAAAKTCMAALGESEKNGHSTGKQFELMLEDSNHWFELSVTRKTRALKSSHSFIVLSRDITSRKNTELQIEKLLVSEHASNEEVELSRKNIEEVINRVSDGFVALDKHWCYTYVNSNAAAMLGRTPEQLIGKHIWTEFPEGVGQKFYLAYEKALKEQQSAFFEEYYPPFDRWFENRIYPSTEGLTIYFHDITDRKKVEIALRESEEAYRATFDQAAVGIARVATDGTFLEVNKRLSEVLGYSHDELLQQTLQDITHEDDLSVYLESLQQLLTGSLDTYKMEKRYICKSGESIWVNLTVALVREVDGTAKYFILVIEDISLRKQAEVRIQELAYFDQLTGLPNRNQLMDRFNTALSFTQRNNEQMSVMFLDLDHFKQINDTLGHSIGDKMLIEVSHRLKSILRDEDILSRMGGDEFILVLPNTGEDASREIALKLIAAVREPYLIEKYELGTTLSIGIAIYPYDGNDFETLFRNADTAMYRVKQASRNDFCFFTEEMQSHSARTLKLLGALRHALARDELQLHYQPQISLQDNSVIGAEALLRWQHPEMGMISPAEFIPIAEESGLILPIGEWVLRTAVTQMKSWIDEGLPQIVIAVNLSVVQLRHPNLPELVSKIVEEAGLPAHFLELELTEAVAMNDPATAITVMDKLHELGIKMSIDDFGTGYSSLNYLKKFKVSKLKIDRSFVRDISDDPDDKAIVLAIINLARSMGMRTIAEGVETAEQLDFLRIQGCDEVQGYYFSKALPSDEFDLYIKNYT